jgi:hypothetical protein
MKMKSPDEKPGLANIVQGQYALRVRNGRVYLAQFSDIGIGRKMLQPYRQGLEQRGCTRPPHG